MNTGLDELAEDSSEEPYSRGLNEITVSPEQHCCLCFLRHRRLLQLRQCNLQLPLGRPVSSLSLSLVGLQPVILDTFHHLIFSPSCSPCHQHFCTQQPSAVYHQLFSPRKVPLDGIRPPTTSPSRIVAQSEKSGNPNCRLHCDTLCQGVASPKESQPHPPVTHYASPEACRLCCLESLCTVLFALLCSMPLARFLSSPTNEQTVKAILRAPFDYHRPSNVATQIELPTLRPSLPLVHSY